MKWRTARWLIAMGVAFPLLAAESPESTMEQAERVSAESSHTAFRLEMNFLLGPADVSPEQDKNLQNVTDYLKNNPNATCEIRGYTDNAGSDEANVKVSQERADNVRKYMIEKLGIAGNRLKARGYGDSDPNASDETEEGRRQNSRLIAVINS